MPTPHSTSTRILVRRMMAQEAEARAEAERQTVIAPQAAVISPSSATTGANELRPRRLAEVIGQGRLKSLLRRLIDAARPTGRPLDRLRFAGAAGPGET